MPGERHPKRSTNCYFSILPVPDGTVIHPTAAERTKFCSSHNRPAPETVTQSALTCDASDSDTEPSFDPFNATLLEDEHADRAYQLFRDADG